MNYNKLRITTPLVEVSYPVTVKQSIVIMLCFGVALTVGSLVMLSKLKA